MTGNILINCSRVHIGFKCYDNGFGWFATLVPESQYRLTCRELSRVPEYPIYIALKALSFSQIVSWSGKRDKGQSVPRHCLIRT